VEREFRAQVSAVADAGLAPAYLDWHCLADGGRDDIFDLTVALAAEYGLAVRAWLDPARRKLRRRGLPAVDHGFLDSFRLDTDGKQARYARLLRDLPAGLSEWAVHPLSAISTHRHLENGHRPGQVRANVGVYDALFRPLAADTRGAPGALER
jgi:chitin disaccharide deacetylase